MAENPLAQGIREAGKALGQGLQIRGERKLQRKQQELEKAKLLFEKENKELETMLEAVSKGLVSDENLPEVFNAINAKSKSLGYPVAELVPSGETAKGELELIKSWQKGLQQARKEGMDPLKANKQSLDFYNILATNASTGQVRERAEAGFERALKAQDAILDKREDTREDRKSKVLFGQEDQPGLKQREQMLKEEKFEQEKDERKFERAQKLFEQKQSVRKELSSLLDSIQSKDPNINAITKGFNSLFPTSRVEAGISRQKLKEKIEAELERLNNQLKDPFTLTDDDEDPFKRLGVPQWQKNIIEKKLDGVGAPITENNIKEVQRQLGLK